ncbi:MAG: hypothetical protein HKP18_06390 [Acidimicrobiia bacterium]|nr:hypothetical protein [Acidimicrobiia bacterium]
MTSYPGADGNHIYDIYDIYDAYSGCGATTDQPAVLRSSVHADAARADRALGRCD